MRNRWFSAIVVGAAVVALLALSGCSRQEEPFSLAPQPQAQAVPTEEVEAPTPSEVTLGQAKQVRVGMTKAQVFDLLGEPFGDVTGGSRSTMHGFSWWRDAGDVETAITVVFRGETVSDIALMGDWEDK